MQPIIFILVGCACSLAAYIAPNIRTIAGITTIAAGVIIVSSLLRHYGTDLIAVSIAMFLLSYVASTVAFWIVARAWQESPALDALRRVFAERWAQLQYARENSEAVEK